MAKAVEKYGPEDHPTPENLATPTGG